VGTPALRTAHCPYAHASRQPPQEAQRVVGERHARGGGRGSTVVVHPRNTYNAGCPQAHGRDDSQRPPVPPPPPPCQNDAEYNKRFATQPNARRQQWATQPPQQPPAPCQPDASWDIRCKCLPSTPPHPPSHRLHGNAALFRLVGRDQLPAGLAKLKVFQLHLWHEEGIHTKVGAGMGAGGQGGWVGEEAPCTPTTARPAPPTRQRDPPRTATQQAYLHTAALLAPVTNFDPRVKTGAAGQLLWGERQTHCSWKGLL
jgi:hypothetical protein